MTRVEKEIEEKIKKAVRDKYDELRMEGPPYDRETIEKLITYSGLLTSFREVGEVSADLKKLEPLVMGGLPRTMHRALTPFYQIISVVFIVSGIAIILLSSFVVKEYILLFPAGLALIFGLMILSFLNKLKTR